MGRHIKQGPALAAPGLEENDLAGRTIFSRHSNAKSKAQRLSINGLADEPRWVAWREEIIENKDGSKTRTKIPYDPHTGRHASIPTDPSTWGTREQAERRWDKLNDGRLGGVGLVLGELGAEHILMGVDLDRCIDREGYILPWADRAIDRFNTYSEFSPSGRGVKLFFLVAAKDGDSVRDLLGGKTRKAFVAGKHREMAIDRARYYAVTEEQAPDTPDTFSVVPLEDVRWFIEKAGPRFLQRYQQTNNESASTKPRDESGSGHGFRFLLAYKRRGESYQAARTAILKDKGPAGDWARRKNERAIKLAWDNIAPSDSNAGEDTDCVLQSSGDFVRDFVPPDYAIDGLLQRRFLYSLTAPTGAGKTSLCLSLAAHTALGMPLAGREILKMKVLFLAGENPDDVRQRWIKLSEEMGFDPESIEVVFLPKVVPLSHRTIRDQIEAQTKGQGPFGLVIVDTNVAYFEGDDENNNAQMAAHARMLRTLIPLIEGGPTIITTCHPTKTPNMDNLVPRGGGAFLAEVDGNLCCLKQPDSMVIELSWHGKFRGPDFAPIFFVLQRGTSERLKDSKGRNIWTITAKPVSDEEHTALDARARRDQDRVMAGMVTQPEASLAELAKALGWFYSTGEPDKTRVNRVVQALIRERLVEKSRGRYQLTQRGKLAIRGRDLDDHEGDESGPNLYKKEPFQG